MQTAWPPVPSQGPEPPAAGRWVGHPWRAVLVRIVVLVVPLVAAVTSATIASRMLPAPAGAIGTALWWSGIIAASTLTLVLVERQARRLLPLATLYKLTLLFPDRAPSRFGVALRAGTVRNLEERLAQGRREGVGRDPSQAAANTLVLVAALSRHDRRTRGHSERVRGFTDLIAEEMRLPPPEGDRLRWAALLHDIGKVRIRPEILNKAGSLNAQEWAIIHRHPIDGARMAAPLRPWLGPWMDAIEQHHERWDGGGYPRGLSGAAIATSARIVAVADAFEVMTAPRSYRRPLGPAAARDELARCAGSHFDPAVVRAFLNVSIGRLRWVMAPVAWLADLPFVRPVAQAGPVAEGAAAGVAVKTFAALSLAFLGVSAADLPPAAPNTGEVASSGQPEKGPEPLDPATLVVPAAGASTIQPSIPAPMPTTSPTQPPAVAGQNRTATTAAFAPRGRPGGGGPPVAANPPPAVTDDVVQVPAGKSERIFVLANDSDPDGLDPKSLTLVSGPAHGKAEIKGNGAFVRYKANGNYVGADTFRYRVCDNRGACSIATVHISVLP
ncbi:MAG: HD domain-containing protein [Actinobacteria bacterium]|nr:HD domain-containing protein [Actinomycetota bacterium]